MSIENVREHKGRRRYTFIVVPDAKSDRTRTFSITRWGLVGTVAAALVVVVALIFAFIIYTPVGSHLPIEHPELVKQYGRQIVEVQKQLNMLVDEMTVLKKYNFQLRKALGEKISGQDTGGLIALRHASPDTFSSARSRPQDASTAAAAGHPQESPSQSSLAAEGKGSQRPMRDFISKLPIIMPADGFVTRGFDAQFYHYGVDIAAKQGSAVLAAAAGNVVFAGWTYEDGFMIILSHDLGFMTLYKHNQSLVKNTGDAVKRGEIIALLGSTGKTSSGSHLHFEVWKNGVVQDPNNFLLSIQ